MSSVGGPEPFYEHSRGVIYCGEALNTLRLLPEASAHCCVTSPPYWGLRDYGTAKWEGGSSEDCDHSYNHGVQGKSGERADRTFTGQAIYKRDCGKCGARRSDQQLGLEATPEEFIARTVEIFRELRRVLRDDGTLWVNIGDSYSNDTKWGGSSGGTNSTSAAGYQGQRIRRGKDCDPKRGSAAPGQPMGRCNGLKPKDLVGIPWMLAFALRADGWFLRSEIIWAKPNPIPESVSDRPTKAHETIFLLAKSQKYFYDSEAIAEASMGKEFRRPFGWADAGDHSAIDHSTRRTKGKHSVTAAQASGNRMVKSVARARAPGAAHDSPFGETRNKRSVWTVATQPFPEAHFATFPPKLIEPCILAGCPDGGTVLDPFSGAGTTCLVAKERGRRFIGIELSEDYCKMQAKRLSQEVFSFEA